MKRRVLAGAAATALAATIVPAAPAFASASATAVLDAADAQVFPGAKSGLSAYNITVTNNETRGVLGGIGAGKTINAIRVNLPVSEAGIKLGPDAGTAAGCTEATKTDLGTTQFLTYRGCSIAPGGTSAISFPAVVGAPLAKDLKGDFRVQVSSDNFATATTAGAAAPGALVSEVNVLEVVGGSVAPATPASSTPGKGVTDGTGTAGQKITYASQVKNHSRSTLTALAGLAGADATDTVTAASLVLAPGETKTSSIPVTLGTAGSRSYVGSATATGADAPAPAASAFQVQVPASFNFIGISNNRTTSKGASREFRVTLEKVGAPSVDTFSANLTFAGNSCALKDAVTFPAGTSTQEVVFSCTGITGADATHPASIAYTLTDANLFGGAGTINAGSIVIDNLAPIVDLVVSLPKDRDGAQQSAVKDNDAITVSGTIANAGDLAANAVTVTLQPTDGSSPLVISAPVGGTPEARTFSGSGSKDWADTALAFTSRAEIKDTAGNTGEVQLPGTTLIDNKAPTLFQTPTTTGRVIDPTTVEVTYFDRTPVRGGCDTAFWLIDGRPGRVSAVKPADGQACDTTNSSKRVLTLSQPLATDDTPTVTYDPTGARQVQSVTGTSRKPVKDGAGNDAAREVIDTVTELVPDAPRIINLLRRNGTAGAAFEPAYLDAQENAYYTNVGGDDALELEVAGVKQGYAVEVRDAAGTRRGYQQFTAAPGLGATEYNGKVLVDLPTTVGTTLYTVRLISTQGNLGKTTPFSVVFETTAPTLQAGTISGNTVRAPFSEKVVAGSDFADNWFVSETVTTEEGTARRTVNVDSVAADGLTARALQVTLLDPSRFAGVDYFVQSGTRYEDRAGNPLADTLKPVS